MTSSAETLAAAKKCFGEGPLVRRWMQQNRPRICPFQRLVDLVPFGATVLDVGCGDGLFLGLLVELQKGIRGLGFDASAVAISSATAMAGRIGASDRIRFLQVDARSEWPEGEFDVVSVIDVIHHVPRSAQQAVIELAAARVRPGGILLYKDIAGGMAGFMNRLHDFVVARELIHYVPVDEVVKWAAGKALHLEYAADLRLFWYPHLMRSFRRS